MRTERRRCDKDRKRVGERKAASEREKRKIQGEREERQAGTHEGKWEKISVHLHI